MVSSAFEAPSRSAQRVASPIAAAAGGSGEACVWGINSITTITTIITSISIISTIITIYDLLLSLLLLLGDVIPISPVRA